MSRYRALLARPGALRVAVACAAGWLSFSSYEFAIVLAVRAETGSFSLAGGASALFAIGSAALAPARGRAVDRLGRRALVALAGVHTVAMAALAAASSLGWPRWSLLAAGVLAGAAAPPLIATARACWPQVAGPDLARTAHALNAALGDVAGVAGPAMTGAIAAAVSPLVALWAVVPGPILGVLLLGRGAPHAPAGSARPDRRLLGVLAGSAGLRTIVLSGCALGVTLGALQVAAPAIASTTGPAGLGALPLSCLAASSATASLWAGSGRRWPAAARFTAGWLIVAAALLPCLAAGSLIPLTLLTLTAGTGLGLLTTALFELLDQITGPGHSVEALTWLTSLQALGLAAGAAGTGQLAGHGATTTLTLVALPPLAGVALVLTRLATLRPAANTGPASVTHQPASGENRSPAQTDPRADPPAARS